MAAGRKTDMDGVMGVIERIPWAELLLFLLGFATSEVRAWLKQRRADRKAVQTTRDLLRLEISHQRQMIAQNALPRHDGALDEDPHLQEHIAAAVLAIPTLDRKVFDILLPRVGAALTTEELYQVQLFYHDLERVMTLRDELRELADYASYAVMAEERAIQRQRMTESYRTLLDTMKTLVASPHPLHADGNPVEEMLHNNRRAPSAPP